jgi:hypothetical protein
MVYTSSKACIYIKGNMVWYIWYKSKTPNNQIERATNPKFPRKRTNVAWSRGFVKMSASWSWVGTWLNTMVPFYTLSLKKWYLTSMCLVLEWSTRFFATLMELVQSQRSGIWVHSSTKSLKVYEIHNSWEQQLAAATYSVSVVDWATLDCLREDHETNEDPRNWQEPEVDFLSTRQPAKSASEKPWSERVEEEEYRRPRPGADCSYLKILLTACRCDVLGEAWKRAHRHTLNCMSGLVAVK